MVGLFGAFITTAGPDICVHKTFPIIGDGLFPAKTSASVSQSVTLRIPALTEQFGSVAFGILLTLVFQN